MTHDLFPEKLTCQVFVLLQVYSCLTATHVLNSSKSLYAMGSFTCFRLILQDLHIYLIKDEMRTLLLLCTSTSMQKKKVFFWSFATFTPILLQENNLWGYKTLPLTFPITVMSSKKERFCSSYAVSLINEFSEVSDTICLLIEMPRNIKVASTSFPELIIHIFMCAGGPSSEVNIVIWSMTYLLQ